MGYSTVLRKQQSRVRTAFDGENAELGVATAYGRAACTSPVRNTTYAVTK